MAVCHRCWFDVWFDIFRCETQQHRRAAIGCHWVLGQWRAETLGLMYHGLAKTLSDQGLRKQVIPHTLRYPLGGPGYTFIFVLFPMYCVYFLFIVCISGASQTCLTCGTQMKDCVALKCALNACAQNLLLLEKHTPSTPHPRINFQGLKARGSITPPRP